MEKKGMGKGKTSGENYENRDKHRNEEKGRQKNIEIKCTFAYKM